MGAESYGIYAYVATWLTVLLIFSKLGIDTLLVRYVSTYHAKEQWAELRGLRRRGDQIGLGSSVVIAALVVGIVWGLQDSIRPELEYAFYATAGLLPILTLVHFRKAIIQAFKRPALSQLPIAVIRPFGLLVLAGSVYGIGRVTLDGPTVVLLDIGATAVALGAAAWWSRTLVSDSVLHETPVYYTGKWVKVALPLFWVAGLLIIFKQTDTLLVGLVVGTTEAGIYDAAWRYAALVTFGQSAGNMMVAPMISELYQQKRTEELQRVVKVASWMATVLSILIGGGLIIFSDLILGLYGSEFLVGATALTILVFGQGVNALAGPVGLMLNMTEYERVNARITTILVMLNICLNYPAIVYAGKEGAALVTALVLALHNIWTWWEVRKKIGINSSIFSV